jgi:glycosyltransferase involved in cell wall biosynthesis
MTDRLKLINYFVFMKSKEQLNTRRWYIDEINILNHHYKVNISVKPNEINYKSSLFFSWWAQTSFPSVLIAYLSRKPSIVVAGGSEVSKAIENFGYNSKNFLRKFFMKVTLHLSTHIIAISEYNKLEILNIIGRKHASKISVLYLCVQEKYFNTSRLVNPKRYIVMISVLNSNNILRKSIKECIAAIGILVKDIPDIQLIIIGEKEKGSEEIIHLINQYKLASNISLEGFISEDKKIHLLKNAYCYLQPTYHEQFGLAIAEAMASSCPVISTNVAAVPEVLGDTGILIEENTPLNIANSIRTLYYDKNLRDSLSIKTSIRAKELFSYNIKESNFVKIINNFINKVNLSK